MGQVEEAINKLLNAIEDWEDANSIECDNCWDKIRKEDAINRTVYDSPFDYCEEEKHFCSLECEQSYLSEYFDCAECCRTIAESNGKLGYQRGILDPGGNVIDYICLGCYEKDILINGIPRTSFENQRMDGMFFNYGNEEVKNEGFEIVEGFDYHFISSQEDINKYCKKALELIDKGKKVITCYERLSIMGDEGYVTMMVKGE